MRGKASPFARRPLAVMVFAVRLPLLFSVVLLFLAACSFIPRDSFTAQEQSVARIPGIPNARFWVDGTEAELRDFLRGSVFSVNAQGRFDVLAISGGAYDGAYGAGVINGWTASGTRPRFGVVTGVSAGALIAPLAFLGPDYDRELAEAFSGGAAQVLGDIGGVFALLGTPDLRRQNLVDLVDRFVDERLMRSIAIEHARGRRLFIVTTNLDAQRGVIWDMGAIASAGPQYRELFRDVLVASASIPGVFGPTFIEVEANGRRFREMHVDGGATTQVFVLPDVVLAKGMRNPNGGAANVWIVINNHTTPQFEVVEAGLLSTVSRSFSTLIKNDAKDTLLATVAFIGRERFNLTSIDSGFDEWLKANPSLTPGFNTAYMQALYQYGYNKALSGHLWSKQVPLPGGRTPKRFQEIAGQ